MKEVRFFDRAGPHSLGEIAEWVGGELRAGDPERVIVDVATLDRAGPDHITFFDNPRYSADLEQTAAGACLVAERLAEHVPGATATVIVAEPSTAFNTVLRRFYPEAAAPAPVWGAGPSAGNAVHDSALIEEGVQVEPGAVVGAQAQIGRGSRIMAGAVIGRRVRVGRGCVVGPGASILNTLIGDNVIIHPGVRIGQDGFGYAMGRQGHTKVPQIGRVIVQDNVEIGANTTIDRGALRDTIIGEGTKIDNQVQIGHNVVIGRHCIIVAQVGIAGSATLEDFVAIGGQAGVMTHVTIGEGAEVAALSAVRDDLEAGGRYGGVPARPAREWLREVAALQKLARREMAAPRRAAAKDGRGADDD